MQSIDTYDRTKAVLEQFDPNDIQDIEGARQAITYLLNLIEEVVSENRELREENQRLRDENNRLKGEQGKPKVKPSKKATSPNGTDHSSERERRTHKPHKRRAKVNQIQVDREQTLTLDLAQLPEDAEFKDYVPVVVQDVRLVTDNIRFLKEKHYSASQNKTYLAELPAGYKGEFGPGVRTLAHVLYHAVNTSQPKIAEFFEYIGIQISSGQVSNLLIKDQDRFHAEKDAVYAAGLRSSPWQHIDETGTRVNGVNQHCHVLCNPFYTVYLTTEKKDRLTVIDVLTNLSPRAYLLQAQTYAWLRQANVSASVRERLRHLPQDRVFDDQQFNRLLDEHLAEVNAQHRRRILEAAAITAYHVQQEVPVVQLLISDDAPQFKRITDELALCWVHDARYYKKLSPALAYHRHLLDQFMNRYWAFYDQLLAYRKAPAPEQVPRLEAEFDTLFFTVTGYTGLDRRIAMTRDKRSSLLMVLRHPEIPLHNNPAEIEMRRRVRKRDVSFGPRTADGKRAWDTFATLLATTKKLGLSFYRYIYDRVAQCEEIPSLADLIVKRAQQMNPAASWEPV
jgi:regulator of replication initiation timing